MTRDRPPGIREGECSTRNTNTNTNNKSNNGTGSPTAPGAVVPGRVVPRSERRGGTAAGGRGALPASVAASGGSGNGHEGATDPSPVRGRGRHPSKRRGRQHRNSHDDDDDDDDNNNNDNNNNDRKPKQPQRTKRGSKRKFCKSNSSNNKKPPEGQHGICGAGSFGSWFLPRKPPTARRRPLLFTIALGLLLLYGIFFPVYYYAVVFRTQSPRQRAIDRYQHRHLPPPVRDVNKNNNNNNNNKAGHLPTSSKTVRFVPRYPRMIHLLHIHKSAGTFLCKLAYRNRMAANYKRNCNVRNDMRCCWYGSDDGLVGGHDKHKDTKTSAANKGKHRNKFNNLYDFKDNNDYNTYHRFNETEMAAAAIRFASEAPYDFVATEKELAGPMLPDHFDYVVSLRDSRDRYGSHWRHVKRDAETIWRRKKTVAGKRLLLRERHERFHLKHNQRLAGVHQAADSKSSDEDEVTKERKDDPGHYNLTVWDPKVKRLFPVGNFTRWLEGQPDNYNLRMVCGSACSGVPKYKITGELFAFSLERLWVNFSHVILVEDMEASLGSFATAYGWNVSLEEDHNGHAKAKASAKANANAKAKSIHGRPFPVDTSWDPYMTVLDDALYELARRKLQQQQQSPPSAKTVGGDGAPLVPPVRLVWKEEYSREALPNQDLIEAYFREGPLRNCTNPCCGGCSKW